MVEIADQYNKEIDSSLKVAIMDSIYIHCLEYNVTQSAPAKFADNLTNSVMSWYGVPWTMKFSTKDCYREFSLKHALDVFLEIEEFIRPWFETHIALHPALWCINEEIFAKLLYFCKSDFYTKSDKNDFQYYCETMLYCAVDFYRKGVTSAPTIAFLEVYFFACHLWKTDEFSM